MKIIAIIKQSVAALSANKGRSLLTVLGIVIGIGSVIALISLGEGVRSNISGQIAALGTRNLTVMPGGGFGPGGSSQGRPGGGGFSGGGGPGIGLSASSLTEDDLAALSDRSKHPKIEVVSGQITGSAIFGTLSGDRRYSVLGTSETYLALQNLSVGSGHFYGQADVSGADRVVVLGSQLAADLYGTDDPTGNTLEIAGSAYRIIGVLRQASESRLSNPNVQAYIPYTAAAETFRVFNLDMILIRAVSEDAVEEVRRDVKKTLLANHGIEDERLADFSMSSSADLLSLVGTITGTLTSLLAAIAAISLVVGGIGIMNIMLVSVTERTREIGLRKAVGASESDILGQFIVEAVMLTLTGGIIGIGLGALIGRVGGMLIGSPPVITGGSVALAAGVSTLVGLVFGVYPAAKASALNPIDALRYE